MSLFGSLSENEFFDNYWRKKPLLIRGGVKNFCENIPTSAEYDKATKILEEKGLNYVSRDGDKVIFTRNLEQALEGMENYIEKIKQIFKWSDISIDGVKAQNSRSIGSHFDHSDNFVLNIHGKKIWRLHPADFIPNNILRRRLRDEANIGKAPMPKNCIEWELLDGDLLYIPLFWVHWGVSSGNSYSISVALNACSPEKAFLPSLMKFLEPEEEWGKPIPRFKTAEEQQAYLYNLYSSFIKRLGDKDKLIKIWQNL